MEDAGSNPAGDADSLGYANLVKRRSSNLRDFVGSTPTPSTDRGDWALASLTGCNPAAICCAGSTPARRTASARSTSGEVAGLSSRQEGLDSPTGYCLAKWRNQQTREVQSLVPSGVGVQLSPWSLSQDGLEFGSSAVSYAVRRRFDPGSCDSSRVGQCSAVAHNHSRSGATPEPGTCSAEYANPVKRSGREPGDFVGSTPTSVTAAGRQWTAEKTGRTPADCRPPPTHGPAPKVCRCCGSTPLW
jgi:hypothetical protein